MISLYPGHYLKTSEYPAQEPHKLWDSRPQGKSHSSNGVHPLQTTETDWKPGLEACRKSWGKGQKHRLIYSKVNLCLNGLVFMSVTSYSQDRGCAQWCWCQRRHRADAIKHNVVTMFNGSFNGSALKIPIFKIERGNDWFLFYEYSWKNSSCSVIQSTQWYELKLGRPHPKAHSRSTPPTHTHFQGFRIQQIGKHLPHEGSLLLFLGHTNPSLCCAPTDGNPGQLQEERIANNTHSQLCNFIQPCK